MNDHDIPLNIRIHAFFEAVSDGSIDSVKQQIADGMSVDCVSQDNENPLHAAIRWGRDDMIWLLLSHGAHPNGSGSKIKATPLHYAVSLDKKNAFTMLLDADANPSIANISGITPAHAWMATSRWKKEKSIGLSDIEKLISHGMAIDQRDEAGNTILMQAIDEGNGSEFISCLVRLGADINLVNGIGKKPIHLAARSMNIESLDYLVSIGANINDKDWAGNSPLHLCQSSELARKIIALGGSIDAKNNHGDTPLMSVVNSEDYKNQDENQKKIIMLLLDSGADPDCKNQFNASPRSIAVERNFDVVLQLLTVFDAKKAMLQVAAGKYRKVN